MLSDCRAQLRLAFAHHHLYCFWMKNGRIILNKNGGYHSITMNWFHDFCLRVRNLPAIYSVAFLLLLKHLKATNTEAATFVFFADPPGRGGMFLPSRNGFELNSSEYNINLQIRRVGTVHWCVEYLWSVKCILLKLATIELHTSLFVGIREVSFV